MECGAGLSGVWRPEMSRTETLYVSARQRASSIRLRVPVFCIPIMQQNPGAESKFSWAERMLIIPGLALPDPVDTL